MSEKRNFSPDNYDAFISYRHESGFYMAQVIYDKLVLNGYSVFMDKRLERGEFEPQIKTALQKSRNFILVVFPGDLDTCNKPGDWIRKECEWAANTPGMNFIPVLCDEFNKDDVRIKLPPAVNKVLKSHGVVMHKDPALESDLDKLCDTALVNANPVRPLITTIDFFKNNINNPNKPHIKGIDMAFHGGGAWRRPGTQKDLLDDILKRKIPTRILINTPEAAESIAQYMRDYNGDYSTFENLNQRWKLLMQEHPRVLEVRACPIPLLRVYHSIRFKGKKEHLLHDRIHVKYYVYQNMNLEKSFEHEISAFSKYYELYQDEFEFLWNSSKPL